MAFIENLQKIDKAREIKALHTNSLPIIGQLETNVGGLKSLLTEMKADTDTYSAADCTEVQEMVTYLNERIANIAK